MVKALIFNVIVPLIFSTVGYAEETFSISGKMETTYDGDLYIGVYTMKDWQNLKDRFPSSPYFQKLKITPAQGKAGKIPFKFIGIKKGEYSIIAFQDKNKNGEIDRLLGGKITEPRGLYREPIAWPSWGEMSFKLDRDIDSVDIVITDSIYEKSQ